MSVYEYFWNSFMFEEIIILLLLWTPSEGVQNPTPFGGVPGKFFKVSPLNLNWAMKRTHFPN